MNVVEIVLAVIGIAAGVWAVLKGDVQIAGVGIVILGVAILLMLLKIG